MHTKYYTIIIIIIRLSIALHIIYYTHTPIKHITCFIIKAKSYNYCIRINSLQKQI